MTNGGQVSVIVIPKMDGAEGKPATQIAASGSF